MIFSRNCNISQNNLKNIPPYWFQMEICDRIVCLKISILSKDFKVQIFALALHLVRSRWQQPAPHHHTDNHLVCCESLQVSKILRLLGFKVGSQYRHHQEKKVKQSAYFLWQPQESASGATDPILQSNYSLCSLHIHHCGGLIQPPNRKSWLLHSNYCWIYKPPIHSLKSGRKHHSHHHILDTTCSNFFTRQNNRFFTTMDTSQEECLLCSPCNTNYTYLYIIHFMV